MKEVKWDKCSSTQFSATIGNMYLYCFDYPTWKGRSRWSAHVSIRQSSGYLKKTGPYRHSLSKAKADAIRLTEELLIDLHTSIMKEMKACGIDPGLL